MRGELRKGDSVTVDISPVNELSSDLHVQDVIEASLSSESNIYADLSTPINISGTISIPNPLDGVMRYIGETTTPLHDGAYTTPITIHGNQVVPYSGDVVLYLNKEFIYTEDGKWNEFGSPDNLVLRGTKEYWDSQPSLISKRDVIYIYTNYKTVDHGDGTFTVYQAMKIGDGGAYLIDIPFIGEGLGITITQEDIDRWNSKWRGYLDTNNFENLIFTTE